ncbi:MAG: hypothetical protein Q7S58_12475 [Candidatus Binatus sp.]|uniref:hypothetical protein n=1 Tax=Candidatus Binatus sp. TaxID=2811406 RepID=UPI0027170977|nr:hypothetical protein [Candidatus Binatus sp.]MDO8433214.1 hypothetical protein [Candidatus Binatus sp.]
MADRVLIHIPIIHTQAEMGTLAKEIGSRLAKELGPRWQQKNETAVDSLWDRIETMLAEIDLPYGKVRIYQDGLPVCGREMDIVNELAKAGSRNHRLIAELAKKGATIMGTESGELLIEEYRRVKQILAQSGATAKAGRTIDAGPALIQKRDRFMAERIDRTLQPGEIGILFVGMLHSVQRYLASDITVIATRPLSGEAAGLGRKLREATRGSA